MFLTAIVVLQVIIIATFFAGRSDRPHAAPLDIVAPPVVAASLSDSASAHDDPPFDPQPATADEAREHLEEGSVVGVVTVDLTADEDTLTLSPSNGSALDQAVTEQARTLSASLGRTMKVTQADVDSADRRLPYLVVLASLIGGFVLAAIPFWRRGRIDRLREGVARHLEFAAISAALGAVVAVGAVAIGCSWRIGVVAGALVLVASTFSNALGALWGLPGLALASAITTVTAISMLSFTSPYLLSGWWRTVDRWLPEGAGLRLAMNTIEGGNGSPRDWAVLAAYIGLAILTAAVARQARTHQPEPASVASPDRNL